MHKRGEYTVIILSSMHHQIAPNNTKKPAERRICGMQKMNGVQEAGGSNPLTQTKEEPKTLGFSALSVLQKQEFVINLSSMA
jgi:hypothetical protein